MSEGFIEEAIGKLLAEHAGVINLVQDRVYAPIAKQNTGWPCVVFRSVPVKLRDEILEPPGSSGLVRTRIRVFSANKTPSGYAVIKRLDKQVRLALQGFAGVVITNASASPIETVEIQGVFCHTTSGVDDYDDKTEVHSVISDFDVWHNEERTITP